MEVEEMSNVWANTRRFFRVDFMFFRWIYKIFSRHGLQNYWWEFCENENPIEEINPGDTYQDLLPFIAIANIMGMHDSLKLCNFSDMYT